MYEIITESRSWKNIRKDQGDWEIYHYIHQNVTNLNFFNINPSTGNNELNNLINDCLKINPNERPNAINALERLKQINF